MATYRRVCGSCWYVSKDCSCYSYRDKGLVRRIGGRTWMAQVGLDLMEPARVLGYHYPTRRAAAAALDEVQP